MAHVHTTDDPNARQRPGSLPATPKPPSHATIRRRLDRVTDPELDRSIVALDYIDAVEIDGSQVFVRFKLPTAWCSPAFAWMMAVDIRKECESLPGVDRTEIELIDHMHDAEINAGVNAGRSFENSFGEATTGIEETRRSLDRKARLARQHRAVRKLRERGLSPEQIVSLTPRAVGFETLSGSVTTRPGGSAESIPIEIDDGALFVQVDRDPIAAYIEKAIAAEVLDSIDDPLFKTPDGEAISESTFDLVQQRCRAATVNQTGQGGVCAGLHEARYGRRDGPEPTD